MVNEGTQEYFIWYQWKVLKGTTKSSHTQTDIPGSDVFNQRIGEWQDGQIKSRQKKSSLKDEIIITMMLMVTRKSLLQDVMLSILHYKHFFTLEKNLSSIIC